MSKRLDDAEWRLDCLNSRMDALQRADDDPCWEGYEQRGTKEKGGDTVPNCVKADAGADVRTGLDQRKLEKLYREADEQYAKYEKLLSTNQDVRRQKAFQAYAAASHAIEAMGAKAVWGPRR